MKWIPLSERKPDKTDRYIIYSGDVYAADYNEKYDAWSDDNQIVSYEITHWMPMPPLPEPEKLKDPEMYLDPLKLIKEMDYQTADAHLLKRIIDLENKFDNLEERHSDLLENFIKWICRFSKLTEVPKSKDPDWEKFEKDFNRMHYDNDEMSDLAACVFAIYRFLKAKY